MIPSTHRPQVKVHTVATRRRWLYTVLAFCVPLFACFPAHAQTTSGNSGTGASLWAPYDKDHNPSGKGCGGCHSLTAAPINAANAGGHILYAIAHGMPTTLMSGEANDVAEYIGQSVSISTVTVAANSNGNPIALPGVSLGTVYGKFSAINIVSNPTKGSVSFTGTTAAYTPNAGQTGADSFTYQAVVPEGCGGNGCSSVRTQSVNIVVPAPSNDNFASPKILSGGNTSDIGINVGATVESGEPNHAGQPGGHSVWWNWTAPSTNLVTIDTCNTRSSSNTIFNNTFDTLLAVYTGNAVNALQVQAFNDDSTSCLFSSSSFLQFNAVSGTIYHIAVDGYAGATGNIRVSLYQEQTLKVTALNTIGASGRVVSDVGGLDCLDSACTISVRPGAVVRLTATAQPGSAFGGWLGAGCSGYGPTCIVTVNAATGVFANFRPMTNDNFASRIVLPGGTTSGFGYNSNATKEVGEPNHAGNAGGHSLWWTWIAPVTGSANITLAGSDFDTLLGVYTGTALGSLTQIAANDDFGGSLQSEVTFYATAGTEYHFAIDGFGGAVGTVNFLIRQPGNDNFVSRLFLTGGTVDVVDSSLNATRETGEPRILSLTNGGHSLWWSWTAPTTDNVTITTIGSNFDTILGVYTGSVLSSLALVAANDDFNGNPTSSVTFAATAGTSYQIAVDSFGSTIGGNIALHILEVQPQNIYFPAIPNQVVSPSPMPLVATATSGLPVAFTSFSTLNCTVAGNVVTLIAVGTCSIFASQAGDASWYAASAVLQSFTITQGSQSITFGAQTAQSFSNGGMYTLNPQATASSGLAVSYASNTPLVCTVAGANVRMVAAGTCSITASQAGNANYTAAAPVTVTFAINPGAQTITFPAQAAQPYSPGGSFMIGPIATSTSGLTVTYGSGSPLICTVSGAGVSILATGACNVTANQAGNANFNPAPQVSTNITINPSPPAAPVIGTATPGDAQAAIAFSPSANTGGSALTGFRATCNPGGVFANAAASPISVTGLTNGTLYTCSVTATNAAMLTSVASGTVAVTPTATPVPPAFSSVNGTTFTVLSAGTFNVTATGTPAPTLSLTGAPANGVNFTPGTGVLAGTPATGMVGTYPLTFTAMNASGTVMQAFTLTVQKANQTITFNNPGAQAFSAVPLMLVASSTSLQTVSFASSTPSTCSASASNLTMITVGSCTIVASQSGNADFNTAPTVMQSFSIGASVQSITFGVQAVGSRSFARGGTFAINPPATASSGLAVVHSSTTPSVCSVSGITVTMFAAGTCTLAANQSGDANYSAATQVTRNVTITATVPGAPTIGTATAGIAQATISFTPPVNTGGSAIAQYTATCNLGAITGTNAASPIVVMGLTNGVSYTCTVTATNANALTSVASTGVMVTPLTTSGATIWTNTCSGCHGATPAPPRFNAAGSSTTVLDYIIATQPLMIGNVNVTGLTPTQRAAVAAYLLSAAPAITATTPSNTPVPIDVFGNIVLNSSVQTFQQVEVVTAPANGMLSAFSGTQITYTPNLGFAGTDSFTYRGKHANAIAFDGDAREVIITVSPAIPAITSPATATGTYGQPFSYQTAATNLPTLFGATGLPAGVTPNAGNGLISGIPSATGLFNAMISAGNAGGTGNLALDITIGKASQIITFPTQVSLTRPFSVGGTFPVNPLATGGGSGNSVTYSPATPGVCTVSSSTVTIVAAGVCTIAANQLGNSNYSDAAAATQSVTITPIAPNPPVIGTAAAGFASALIAFTAPAQTGGSPITQYTVTCNNGAVPVSGSSSPILVTQLTIGLQYTCSVTATSAGGTSGPSGSVMVTPVTTSFSNIAFSRKTHNGIDHDLPINLAPPLNGAVTVEPRVIGAGHRIVFAFNSAITIPGTAIATDLNSMQVGTASTAVALDNNNNVVVTLTGVADATRVQVTLSGVNGAVGAFARIGFLVGDVTNNHVVNAADISAVKAHVGLTTDSTNFIHDLNASGTISNADVTDVKARSGLVLQ